jgi:hypothetical protein
MGVRIHKIVTKISAQDLTRMDIGYMLYGQSDDKPFRFLVVERYESFVATYSEIELFRTIEIPNMPHPDVIEVGSSDVEGRINGAMRRWFGLPWREIEYFPSPKSPREMSFISHKLHEATPKAQAMIKQMMVKADAADPDELPSSREASAFIKSNRATSESPWLRAVEDVQEARQESFAHRLDTIL